jgi:hypothetical protein
MQFLYRAIRNIKARDEELGRVKQELRQRREEFERVNRELARRITKDLRQ